MILTMILIMIREKPTVHQGRQLARCFVDRSLPFAAMALPAASA